MIKQQHNFLFEEYNSADELKQDDAFLLNEARSATQFAYAPYSNFQVGAAAKLINGEVVIGSNQENASYPVGICAERVLLSSASSQYPNIAIDTIAISYNNMKGTSNTPASPCGICRQTISEYQERGKRAIRLILSGMEGKVIIVSNAADLLPLSFSAEDMK
ncbi:MAG: cytidine deaminase [Chitinophagaceae bacterium]|nr:cytidine deaminase [Chitinophagaceae bacterium]